MTEPHDEPPIPPTHKTPPVDIEAVAEPVGPSTGNRPGDELLIDSLMHSPPPAGEASPDGMPQAAVAPRQRSTPLWLTVLLVILLCFGLFALWQTRPAPVATIDPARFAALDSDLKAAQQRIAALEQRPIATPPDTTRIAAVEKSVSDLARKPPPDTSALEARIATLERKPPPDTTALESRITTLENKPAPVIPDVAKDVQTAVAGASAALDAKISSLDTKLQQDADQARARAAEADARAATASRARVAGVALEAGQPLGVIAGAPPALSRFATAAAPTEPALRQSFPRYANAAEEASKPSPVGHSFAERMWMRAQGLVTVRQGDHVLVGAPAAVTLEAARGKLDAGDLAGALKALDGLDAAATTAIAPWKQDAQALLDARAALASLAAKS